MPIVGISGVIGSGKSTAAACMKKRGYVMVGLADPLKRISNEVLKLNWEQLNGSSSKRSTPHPSMVTAHGKPLTPRYALQRLGDWGRDCNLNTWIDYGLYIARELMKDFSIEYSSISGLFRLPGDVILDDKRSGVVFHDVRFRNEMNAIRKEGGVLIRVKRGMTQPSFLRRWWFVVQNYFRLPNAHQSETEQLSIPDSEFDYVIDNRTMTIDELDSEIGRICQELEKP